MITQEQIESKGFTFLDSIEVSKYDTVLNRDRYTAEVKSETIAINRKNEFTIVLNYFDNDEMTITSYLTDNPLNYPEYFFIGLVNTENEFNKVIENLKFEFK